MKFAILGDTHWGCRKDSPIFYKHFEKFYGTFLNHMESEGIKLVIQLGDTFETRKQTNSLTLSEAKRIYFSPAQKAGIHTYITVGNHDIYHRESVSVNTPKLLLSEYSTVKVIDKPQLLNIGYFRGGLEGGDCIDLIPWICKENEKEIAEYIRNSTAQYCAGHFEIAGFAMYKGMEENAGLDMKMFDRYEHVWSGHYHTKSRKGNILYVATPYEMTWEDADDPKGYHIFDTDTKELVYHQNTEKIFIRLNYDDSLVMEDPIDLEDKFVRVLVTGNSDPKKLDRFLQKIDLQGVYDKKVSEDMASFSDGVIDTSDMVIENTMSVMDAYIDSVVTDINKDALKKFMHGLYVEAIAQDAV